MKNSLNFPLFIAMTALLLSSGCSTIVNHGRTRGLNVKSDPRGADVYLDGVLKGRTPINIQIEGGSAEHVVRLEKAGYEALERTVSKKTDPWVWGNAPFAAFPIVAAAGLGVDAWCGQWYCVKPASIDVILRAGRTAGSTPYATPTAKEAGKPAEHPFQTQRTPASMPVSPQRDSATSSSSSQKAPSVEEADAPAAVPKTDEMKKQDEMDEILKQVLENN